MRSRVIASTASVLCAVLLPKCPMCIAAWLSILGIGAGIGAAVGLVLRPLAIAVAVTTAVTLLASWLRARATARGACCSQRDGTPR